MTTTRPTTRPIDLVLTLVFLALPLLLVACDSGGSNGGDDSNTFSVDKGSFTLTVTEEGTENEFSGGAVFGVGSEASSQDEEAFVIYMLDGEKVQEDDGDVGGTWTEMIIRDRETPEIPSSTGAMDLSRWDMRSTEISAQYGTSGGTVQITSVSDSELEGTFSYDAFGASVEGSFTAKKTDDANRVVCAPTCADS